MIKIISDTEGFYDTYIDQDYQEKMRNIYEETAGEKKWKEELKEKFDNPTIKTYKPNNRGDEAYTTYTKAETGGLRYDTGKNRLDLIPPEWTWALGQILTKGAQKYAARNWEKGMDWSRIIGPLKRHLEKFQAGEQYDQETGCHHMAMVAWNALALMTYDIREIGSNDLVGKMEWLEKTTNSYQKQEETKKENNNESRKPTQDRNKV